MSRGNEPEEEEPEEKAKPTIDERIAELEAMGFDNEEKVLVLYREGYSTHEIMKRHLPLKALAKKDKSDESVMGAIAGTAKGEGYLDEFKTMIRLQISRNREFTDTFYNIGLGILLASLHKAGLTIEDFRAIALKGEGLREALEEAGETAFKALEYYQSDLIGRVEEERDEARAYSSYLAAQWEELSKQLDPKFRLEKMIHVYLLSGGADSDILMSLIDKWLAVEMGSIKLELMR